MQQFSIQSQDCKIATRIMPGVTSGVAAAIRQKHLDVFMSFEYMGSGKDHIR